MFRKLQASAAIVCLALLVALTPAMLAGQSPSAPTPSSPVFKLPLPDESPGRCTASLAATDRPVATDRQNCHCWPGGVTPAVWGMGATCAEATANMNDNIYTLADEGCSPDVVCFIGTPVIDTECFTYNGMIRTDGHASYKCEVCIDIQP